MIKAVVLLKRREDMSRSDFVHWYLDEHVPLALALPNLRRYQANIVEGEADGDYDGFSELWFDSETAMLESYATETGKGVAADSLAHVSRRERIVVREHPFEVSGR
ncbi:MAG: EthD family reductase [Kiloniellales bacterium]|nr:EthD family reductase [Kiloniellales bacterium]